MEEITKSETTPGATPVVSTEQPITKSSYGKRNWKKWILIYIVMATLLCGGVYVLFLSKVLD